MRCVEHTTNVAVNLHTCTMLCEVTTTVHHTVRPVVARSMHPCVFRAHGAQMLLSNRVKHCLLHGSCLIFAAHAPRDNCVMDFMDDAIVVPRLFLWPSFAESWHAQTLKVVSARSGGNKARSTLATKLPLVHVETEARGGRLRVQWPRVRPRTRNGHVGMARCSMFGVVSGPLAC